MNKILKELWLQRQQKLFPRLIWVWGARIQLINMFELEPYDPLSILAPSPVLGDQSIYSPIWKISVVPDKVGSEASWATDTSFMVRWEARFQ